MTVKKAKVPWPSEETRVPRLGEVVRLQTWAIVIEAQVGNGLGRADERERARSKIAGREVAFERKVTRSPVVMRGDGPLFGRQKERESLGWKRW